jgi:hypothetical protein
MHTFRIPDFANKSREGMSIWFAEMALRGLLFHPEDAPSDIMKDNTREQLFSSDECARINRIIGEMFTLFGDDVCETCYPIFMNAAGFRVAA